MKITLKLKGKKAKEKDKTNYISIRRTKSGCRINDVATALHVDITAPMKWIEDCKVKTINGPGIKGDKRYIDPESLRDFLLEQRNTEVTFDETKGVAKLPKLRWPK